MRGFRWLRRRTLLFVACSAAFAVSAAPSALAIHGGDTEVTVGSNDLVFSQNKQNEPALAVDANHPNVLAAGANDNIDMEACNAGDDTTCPFTPGVGVSGIYFSFDSGDHWVQPTYTGFSARVAPSCLGVPGPDPGCTPDPSGPIGTLPWYYESGLVSDGDPALAFGPRPDGSGHFSWENGSRLYYANLTSNFGATRSESVFRGFEALAVSRTDDVETAADGGEAGKAAWMRPVIVTRQASTTFMDKEQIWADNASSSPFFGNVYICSVAFRSNSRGGGFPAPIIVATSSDGGNTWRQKQVSAGGVNAQHPGGSGCSVRTDSHGRVYVFWVDFAIGFPGVGSHVMITSDNGGHNWSRPRHLFTAVDLCTGFDPVINRCVMDGVAGARDDLGPAPSVDIANGAPTGADATNEIVDTWADGRDGLNSEDVMFSYSTNRGESWASPTRIQQPSSDRGYYSAPGISPDGKDVYVVYNAFTTPWRFNTTDPRGLVGVVLHSDIGAGGAPTGFTVLHRGAVGDPRASSQNNLEAEFRGDYVYAVATRDYGAAVWNDVREGSPCAAMNAWRMSLRTTGDPIPFGADRTREGDEDEDADVPSDQPDDIPRPAPNLDCPATFGNTDIFGGSYADPSADATAVATATAVQGQGSNGNGKGHGNGKGKGKPGK
jgi:hypothetical protein